MTALEQLIIDQLKNDIAQFFEQREKSIQQMIERGEKEIHASEDFISELVLLKFQTAKEHRDFFTFLEEQSRNANQS